MHFLRDDYINLRDTVSEQYLAKMGFLRDDYLFFPPHCKPYILTNVTEPVYLTEHPGTSLLIQLMTVVIFRWISSTRSKFQQMGSL